MKASLRTVNDHGVTYQALVFVCPGCAEISGSGFHMLPVNSETKTPSWDWDGNLEAPTLSPSILTNLHNGTCHSFLRAGVFEFLSDCTHSLAGTQAPMSDLEGWMK